MAHPNPAEIWKDDSLVKEYVQFVGEAIPLAAEQEEIMLRVLGTRPAPARVLDLGCGDGRWLPPCCSTILRHARRWSTFPLRCSKRLTRVCAHSAIEWPIVALIMPIPPGPR